MAVAVLQIDGSSSSSNGQTGGRTTQAAPRSSVRLLLLPDGCPSISWMNELTSSRQWLAALRRREKGTGTGTGNGRHLGRAGIGSSNNNCRDYALTQALCSLPMRVDGYVHVCVHSPAPPLSVRRCLSVVPFVFVCFYKRNCF